MSNFYTITTNKELVNCKGLIFKVIDNQYWDKYSCCIVTKRVLRLMKRASCNCPACSYIIKEAIEDCVNDLYDTVGKNLENGKSYKMKYFLDNEEGLVDFDWEEVK